jgi:hypothetical protein
LDEINIGALDNDLTINPSSFSATFKKLGIFQNQQRPTLSPQQTSESLIRFEVNDDPSPDGRASP